MEMEKYFVSESEDIGASVIQNLEQSSGKTVEELQIIGDTEDSLHILVVFTDGKVLRGEIFVEEIDGYPAMRIRGNYVN